MAGLVETSNKHPNILVEYIRVVLDESINKLNDVSYFVASELANNPIFKNITVTQFGLQDIDGKSSELIITLLEQSYDGLLLKIKEQQRISKQKTIFTPINRKKIESAVALYVFQEQQVILNSKRDSLKCNKEDLSHIRKYASIVSGSNNPNLELDTAVLSHFIWQVKRKLFNKPTVFEIMPILFGTKNGTGKSRAALHLFSPLKAYTSNLTVAQLVDSRENSSISRSYIGFLDECSRSTNADMETLKMRISSSETTVRQLYSNTASMIKNNTTFFGTSNRPLDQIIKDPSGLRRFWSINYAGLTQDELINQDFSRFDAIDFESLWKGIDENKEEGYISDIQQELAAVTNIAKLVESFDSWADEVDLGQGDIAVSVSILHVSYKNFCAQHAYRFPETLSAFKQKLSNAGYKLVRTTNIKCGVKISKRCSYSTFTGAF